jgi:limonene-1,2-epoxide hydrolase
MLAAFKHLYNSIQLDNLDKLDEIYAQEITFVDPFHELKGLESLKTYFRQMYQNLIAIEFDFGEELFIDGRAFISWDMHLSHPRLNSGKPFTVPGSSFLQFDDRGKITFHRDYFDGADLIYARLPLLGPVIRNIRSRI